MGLSVNLQDRFAAHQIISDRYELLHFLGEGGFAVVWQARDRVVERDVALKFLMLGHMALNDDRVSLTILERFEREAKLAASIRHPNVVGILDIGHIEGDKSRPYIVMELLDGQDLQDYLREHGPIPATTLWPMLMPCLDALEGAHAMGIVHKDLKPSNLFMSHPGSRIQALRLTDFGIAHIHTPSGEDVKARLTQTGQFLGTPAYLPPEYINQQEISPALDVYQMSLILAEALSGVAIVNSENSLQCLLIHGDGRLELPEFLLQSPLGPVLRKGLALDPSQRYQDAGALAQALQQIDPASIPTPARGSALVRRPLSETFEAPTQPTAPAQPQAQSQDKSPVGLILIAATLFVLCVGAGAFIAYKLFGSTPKDPAPQATTPIIAAHAPETAPTQATPSTQAAPQDVDEPPAGEAATPDMAPPLTLEDEPKPAADDEDKIAREVERRVQEQLKARIKDEPKKPRPKPTPSIEDEDEPDVSAEPDEPKPSKDSAAIKARAERIMRTDPRGAIKLCRKAALLGEYSCYNIIMRAAWTPVRRNLDLEAHACEVLRELRTKNPQDAMGINIQRKFMDCEKRGL